MAQDENDKDCRCGLKLSPQETINSKMVICQNGEYRCADFEELFTLLQCELVPCGAVLDWLSDEPIPKGWLETDGSFFDPLTYPELFSCLGGDQLPDYRGRVVAGVGGVLGGSLNTTTGAGAYVLTPNTIPSHSHVYDDYQFVEEGENDGGGGGVGTDPRLKTITKQTSVTGGGLPVENVQKTVLVRKIIKACAVRDTNLGVIPVDPLFNQPISAFTQPVDDTTLSSDGGGLYTPTYDISLCPLSACLNFSNPSLSSFNIEMTLDSDGKEYVGEYVGDDLVVPIGDTLVINVYEVDNSAWVISNDSVGTFDDIILSSTNFPACPHLATWPNTFVYGGINYTLNSFNSGSC